MYFTVLIRNSNLSYLCRKSFLSFFMELVLKDNEPEKAAKLAVVFGINAQQLLEQAGDILLSNKQFSRAVACYKLSKVSIYNINRKSSRSHVLYIYVIIYFLLQCRLLKSVLKCASAGYTPDLLSCLTHCLASPAISKLPITTRIHLSNLCVLAFIEMTLRVPSQKSRAIYKEFL